MNEYTQVKEEPDPSVGIVQTRYFTFAQGRDRFRFQCGKELGPITLAYETYGQLSERKDNAILILHALSGTAHAAGYHTPVDKYPGWWDAYIGPGKPFDTNTYFIISSNVIGGCNGSTGPSSIDPETGRPYGLTFPIVTIGDMVEAQKQLVEHLGIRKLLAVAGGSMGGMQALEWSLRFPDLTNAVIAIATSGSISAQSIAFNEVGRQAIIKDPRWNRGNYYDQGQPEAGLSLARMIGHITYLSEKNMHERFGRTFTNSDGVPDFDFENEFMVESYLHHQGIKFVDRFDANTYLYITRAIDYFDIKKNYGSLVEAFERVTANFLIVSFTSDWLYPSSQSKEIVQALRANGQDVAYTNIDSDQGHDTFLLKNRALEQNIAHFLQNELKKISG